MTVICSSSDPQQLRALLAEFDPIDDPRRHLLRRRRRARSVAEVGRRRGGDRGPGRRRALAGRSGAQRGNDRQCRAGAPARRQGRVWPGSREVVAAQACKAALRSETGAAAVDMESHIAAAYAAEAGLPFAALRVISDPATRALAGAGEDRDQAERRYRPAQGPARRRAQSADAARAGLDRDRFQSRAALAARLSRLPARRRGPRPGRDLTARRRQPAFTNETSGHKELRRQRGRVFRFIWS